ncbi:MAG TPA: hypothetical protein VF175_15520, partial [Lacipirellula sp.]
MPTIEETMAEAFDAAEARAAEAEKPVEVDPVETAKMPEEQAPASDGPARGPDGKFISKTVEAPEAATPAEPNPAEGAAQADATVTASPSPGAPLSWSAESKAAWSSLPPAIQQEVLKREAEIQKGLDERAAKLRSYEPVEQVLAPRRQQLVAQYGSEAAALNELFMLSDFAARDPGGFIAWFAQQRGVNLGQPAPSGEQADPNDPIAALNRQVEDLRNQLALERRSQLVSQVERFKASGKAPHFEAVRQDMARIAQVEPNLSLE